MRDTAAALAQQAAQLQEARKERDTAHAHACENSLEERNLRAQLTSLRVELETTQRAHDFQQRRADERAGAYERQAGALSDALDTLSMCEFCDCTFTPHDDGGTTPGRLVVCGPCWNAAAGLRRELNEAQQARDEALLEHQETRGAVAAWQETPTSSAAVETKRRRTQLREWLLLSCVHRDNGNTCEDFTEACGYCNAADAIREAEEVIAYLRAEITADRQERNSLESRVRFYEQHTDKGII